MPADYDLLVEFLLSQMANDKGEVSPGQNRAFDRFNDPAWGMLTGGFDFDSAIEPSFEPEPFNPILPVASQFAKSEDPLYQRALQMLTDGAPLSSVREAMRMAAAENELSEDYAKDLLKEIDSLYDEHRDTQVKEHEWNRQQQEKVEKQRQEWLKEQPWHQARLPNPLARYEPEDFNPMAAELARRTEEASQAHDAALAANPATLPDLLSQIGITPRENRSAELAEARGDNRPNYLDQPGAFNDDGEWQGLNIGHIQGLGHEIVGAFGEDGLMNRSLLPDMSGWGGNIANFLGNAAGNIDSLVMGGTADAAQPGAGKAVGGGGLGSSVGAANRSGEDAIRSLLADRWGDDGKQQRRQERNQKQFDQNRQRTQNLAPTARDLSLTKLQDRRAQNRAIGRADEMDRQGRRPFIDAALQRLLGG